VLTVGPESHVCAPLGWVGERKEAVRRASGRDALELMMQATDLGDFGEDRGNEPLEPHGQPRSGEVAWTNAAAARRISGVGEARLRLCAQWC
jgi:hypothetical protein